MISPKINYISPHQETIVPTIKNTPIKNSITIHGEGFNQLIGKDHHICLTMHQHKYSDNDICISSFNTGLEQSFIIVNDNEIILTFENHYTSNAIVIKNIHVNIYVPSISENYIEAKNNYYAFISEE